MKYTEFRALVMGYPLFHSNFILSQYPNAAQLKVQMGQWVNKGYLIQLKRGLYTLSEHERTVGVSKYFIANNLYTPSYVSLEKALSYYGFIPERVFSVTSITTKSTRKFNNPFGDFYYHHIKQHLFTGFIEKQDNNNNTFYIATPEKAIIDFLYFRMRRYKVFKQNIFEESFRFQNMEDVNSEKLLSIAHNSRVKKLITVVDMLVSWLGDNNA